MSSALNEYVAYRFGKPAITPGNAPQMPSLLPETRGEMLAFDSRKWWEKLIGRPKYYRFLLVMEPVRIVPFIWGWLSYYTSSGWTEPEPVTPSSVQSEFL